MLRAILQVITDAGRMAHQRSQLFTIIVILVSFPLLFTYVQQTYTTVANNQIETALKQTVSSDHDVFALLIATASATDVLSSALTRYVEENDFVQSMLIVKEDTDTLVIVAAHRTDLVGTTISDTSWYESAIAHRGETVIYPFLRNSDRIWRTYRVEVIAGERWYLHTEMSLAKIDNQVQILQTQALGALGLSFLILFGLVWWVWRQHDYKLLYQKGKDVLQSQFEFNNVMVHELRAPLTAINGYVSLLSEDHTLSNQQRQYVDRVNLSSKRLLRLVNDFLEVARIQSGTLKVNFESKAINTLLENVVTEMRTTIGTKSISLTTALPSSPLVIATDQVRLQQILTNLVSNAIKYTEAGTITLTAKSEGAGIEIRIEDTGHGISAEDQVKLFTPFTRVGTADAGTEVGSGLGLWITKQLVELLKGRISLESIEGVGTHVIIFLPKNRSKD